MRTNHCKDFLYMNNLTPFDLLDLYKKYAGKKYSSVDESDFYLDEFKIIDSHNNSIQIANSKIWLLLLTKPVKIIDSGKVINFGPIFIKNSYEDNEDQFISQLRKRLGYLMLRRANG